MEGEGHHHRDMGESHPGDQGRRNDSIFCDGDSVTFDIRNPNIAVRGDWKFNLEITADPAVSGVTSGIIEYGTDTSLTYTLTNSDQVAHSVTYRFIPFITDSDGEDCPNGIDIHLWSG